MTKWLIRCRFGENLDQALAQESKVSRVARTGDPQRIAQSWLLTEPANRNAPRAESTPK
jgi:transcriptional regulator GlxA family with amidase domain